MKVERAEYYKKELEELTVKLGWVITRMKEDKIPILEVLNQSNADKGLYYFEALVQSCERELKKIHRERLNGA
jgi:hypothetical protein